MGQGIFRWLGGVLWWRPAASRARTCDEWSRV